MPTEFGRMSIKYFFVTTDNSTTAIATRIYVISFNTQCIPIGFLVAKITRNPENMFINY